MPTTLVSFLGTGPRRSTGDATAGGHVRPGPAIGYAQTTYVFERPTGPPATFTTSLFGAAVLDYLRSIEARDVPRWVILGTSASHWSALIEGLPEASREALEPAWVTIDDHVKTANVNADHLAAWQVALNAADPALDFSLHLVGPALARAEQLDICRALFSSIPPASDVVFDISHGYRHLPVIAAFVIGLMHRTHRLGTARFFSGVYEARTDAGSPAIELPVCQELLEATAATAILDITGNYAPLAAFAGAPDADRTWFFESTFQFGQAGSPAQKALRHLDDKAKQARDPIRALASQAAVDALAWQVAGKMQDRLHKRAQQALGVGDDTRACILAYEALVMAAVRVLDPNIDLASHKARTATGERVNKLLAKASRDEHARAYRDVRRLRNAVVHGTRSTVKRTQTAMADPAAFRAVVATALRVYETWPQFISKLSRA